MQSCRRPIKRNIEPLPSLVEKNSLPIRGKVLSTKEKKTSLLKIKRNPKIQREEHKEKRAMQAREKKTSTLR